MPVQPCIIALARLYDRTLTIIVQVVAFCMLLTIDSSTDEGP